MHTYRVTVSATMPVRKVVIVQAKNEEDALTSAVDEANRSAAGWKREGGYVIDFKSVQRIPDQVCNAHDIPMKDGICEECLKADDARPAKAQRLTVGRRH
jgi:hypothetical protein